jgi:hypothetical protein
MKKILIGVFVVLALVVAAALWFLTSRLDSLVASLVESYGSEIAGTAVRVGSVSIDLRAGRGTIRGLRVANPEGYSSGDAFRLGEITVDIDPKTVTSNPVVIDALVVAAPAANFEVDATGRSNFQVIKSNVDRYSARSGGGSGTRPAAEGGSEAARRRIATFTFEGGTLRADVSAVDPDREPVDAALPGRSSAGGRARRRGGQGRRPTAAQARGLSARNRQRRAETRNGDSGRRSRRDRDSGGVKDASTRHVVSLLSVGSPLEPAQEHQPPGEQGGAQAQPQSDREGRGEVAQDDLVVPRSDA